MNYCPICIKTINNNLSITECLHVFHSSCIAKWLKYNANCPLCREYVSEKLGSDLKNNIVRKENKDTGFKWTELLDDNGVMIGSVPLWIHNKML